MSFRLRKRCLEFFDSHRDGLVEDEWTKYNGKEAIAADCRTARGGDHTVLVTGAGLWVVGRVFLVDRIMSDGGWIDAATAHKSENQGHRE